MLNLDISDEPFTIFKFSSREMGDLISSLLGGLLLSFESLSLLLGLFLILLFLRSLADSSALLLALASNLLLLGRFSSSFLLSFNSSLLSVVSFDEFSGLVLGPSKFNELVSKLAHLKTTERVIVFGLKH